MKIFSASAGLEVKVPLSVPLKVAVRVVLFGLKVTLAVSDPKPLHPAVVGARQVLRVPVYTPDNVDAAIAVNVPASV
jgi:hypothetical protein